VLSHDGAHVAYACSVTSGPSQNGVRVVVDGRSLGPYDDVWGVALSVDGEHLAYGAASGGGEAPWRLYHDGEAISGPQWSIWKPRFSRDGSALAWEMQRQRDARGRVGVGRRPLASFDDILFGPEYGDDTVFWVIRRGRKVIRVEAELRDQDR
jgi:hypothetical protein